MDKNRTLWISQPELLRALLPSVRYPVDGPPSGGLFDRLRWAVLKRLRCLPAAPSYPFGAEAARGKRVKDIRALPLSPLDLFVQRYCGEDAWRYRRCVSRLFLVQRFAWGLPALVTGVDVLVRFALLVVAVKVLFTDEFGAAQRSGSMGTGFSVALELGKAMIVNGVHLWTLLKGF